jgi:PAS domain S-box-containing protein
MRDSREASLLIRVAAIAMLGLFIVLAVVALVSGREVQRASELITKDAVPGTIAAHAMRGAISRSIGYAMVAAMTDTKAEQESSFVIVRAADLAFEKSVKDYEGSILINPQGDRKALDRVKERFAEFLRQRMAYEALIRAGDRTASSAFLVRELVPVYTKVIEAAEELLAYNHANSIRYAGETHASVHELYWVVGVVMALAVICTVVLVMNLTVRRREVLELVESERRLREVMDNLHISVAVLDLGLRVQEMNRGPLERAGLKREDVVGKPFPETYWWSYSDQAKEQFRAALSQTADTGAFMRYDVEYRKGDGTFGTADFGCGPIRDAEGRAKQIVVGAIDITERKQAQEEMRAANERQTRQAAALLELTQAFALRQAGIEELKRVVTQIAAQALEVERVGIWQYDRDRRGLVCQEVFERTKQSHSSGTVLQAVQFPAYFRALVEGKVVAAHDAGRDPRTAELAESYLRPLGISSLLDAPINVIGNVAGVICCEQVGPARQWTADEQTFAIAVANVVSLLLAEEERLRIEQQFLRAQRMEAIGTLAGGVAHDLNNILAPILMAAGLLKFKLTAPGDQGIIALIEGGAQRGAGIIKQLLTFGRGSEGARGLVQVRHLIKDMGHIVQSTFPRNIEFHQNVSADLWPVLADATQLHQILLNFSVNARDAMPKGGTLTLGAQNVELTEADVKGNPQARAGSFVVLIATDTGEGIPREIIDRIFDAFFTTKPVGKGTGLGLSTVQGIVKSHDGFMTVESEPGKGTTFKVYLPAAEKEAAAAAKTTADLLPRGQGETILLVDDEPGMQSVTREILELHNYRVVTAGNGEKAVRRYLEQRAAIKLVVTDVDMPVMDGPELIRSLRVLDEELKFVVMSGSMQDDKAGDLKAIGIDEVLRKPCEPETLLKKLQQALGKPAAR